jgi:hypothetical protein
MLNLLIPKRQWNITSENRESHGADDPEDERRYQVCLRADLP